MVTKQGKSKLSGKHMADLMYAIIICRAKMMSSFGIGIYNLSRAQNRSHWCEFIIQIDPDMIQKFQDITGIELKDTEKIKNN